MAQREKGVATAPCGECGTDLPMQEQADGGLMAASCPKCHPATEKAEKRIHRERATDVTEGVEQ